MKKDEDLPDWSKIDATSIYRAGSDPLPSEKKPELDQLIKETNNFFFIIAGLFVVVFLIVIFTR